MSGCNACGYQFDAATSVSDATSRPEPAVGSIVRDSHGEPFLRVGNYWHGISLPFGFKWAEVNHDGPVRLLWDGAVS